MDGLSLTNPGLVYQDQSIDPTTGQPVIKPRVAFFPSDAARALAFAKQQQSAVSPSTSDVSGDIAAPGETPNNVPSTIPGPTSPSPLLFKPKFSSTLTDPSTGMPAPVNPAQTKLGKLVSILGAAARGALAGWGYGNAAQGAQAARQIPFEQQQQRQELERGQAQTELLHAQASMIPTPYGPMPLGMARYLFPSLIGAQGKVAAANIGAQSREKVAQTNKRFLSVPNVGLYDTQTPDASGRPSLVPNSAQGITVTPEIAADYNLPNEFIGKPMKLSDLAAQENVASKFAPTVTSESSTTDLMGNTSTRRTAQKVAPGTSGPAPVRAPGAPLIPQGGAPQATTPQRPRSAAASPSAAAAPSALPLAPDVEQRLAASGLNAQEQAYVRGLLNYRGQMPSPRAKNYAATLATLTSIDPSFDAPNYDARRKTVMDYSPGGTVGQQAIRFNTSIAHLGMLDEAADALKNQQIPILNRIANFLKVNTGNSAVTTFNNIADAVDGEVSRTFKGTATEGELARVGAHFNASLGADQIKNNIRSTIGLLNGKMGEMESAFQQQMNRPIDMVSPQAKLTLQRISAGGGNGMLMFQDSRGFRHQISAADWQKNQAAIRQRDPGAQLIQ